MVKGQRQPAELCDRKSACRGCIISTNGFAHGMRHKDNPHCVPTRVARGIAIDAKQCTELDVQPRLFERLADACVLYGLAHLHKATRQRPAVRWPAALDQYDAVAGKLNDGIDRRIGRRMGEHASS